MANKKTENSVVPEDRFTPESEKSEDKKPVASAENPLPPLIINGQFIKDLSFEAPNAPDVFSLLQNEMPSIDINVDVLANPKGDKLYEVVLTAKAEAKIKEQIVYICEVEYGGLFTVNVADEHIGPVLLIECPLIIFRFLRRIVADLTGDGGFAPLMLAPIDFAALFQQRVASFEKDQENNNGKT